MTSFGQLSGELKTMIFSYLDRLTGCHRKPGVLLALTNLLQAFLKGSWCLLGFSGQTNLRNNLGQIHFKKSLLAFCKMKLPIKFMCTYYSCGESFLSNYCLISPVRQSQQYPEVGTREKIDKVELPSELKLKLFWEEMQENYEGG